MAAALDALPPEQVGTRQEMALQLALGFSMVPTQGPIGDAHAALVRANELGKALDNLDYQLRALTGLVISSRMADDLSAGLALSRQVDGIAKKSPARWLWLRRTAFLVPPSCGWANTRKRGPASNRDRASIRPM